MRLKQAIGNINFGLLIILLCFQLNTVSSASLNEFIINESFSVESGQYISYNISDIGIEIWLEFNTTDEYIRFFRVNTTNFEKFLNNETFYDLNNNKIAFLNNEPLGGI